MAKHHLKKNSNHPPHPVPVLPDDTPQDPEDNPVAVSAVSRETGLVPGVPHPKHGIPMTRGMVKRFKREHGEP